MGTLSEVDYSRKWYVLLAVSLLFAARAWWMERGLRETTEDGTTLAPAYALVETPQPPEPKRRA